MSLRLAVLGDIHGNIGALRAAYGAVISEVPDEIIHLGDLGGTPHLSMRSWIL